MFKYKLLITNINKMGFKYSIVDYLRSLIFYSMCIMGIAIVHKLKWQIAMLLVISMILLLPFIIYAQFHYTYEFGRFNDYCLYLKQIIIQYKTHKKIKSALESTLEVFKKNSTPMAKCIEEAIVKINLGEPLENALTCIEKKYSNSYIKKTHSYMILGEQIGGDNVYEALNNVKFEKWQNDVINFQKQKLKVRKASIYFTLLSLAISLFCIYLFPANLMQNLFTQTSFQILTFIYFEIILLAYTVVSCGLSGNWINEKE